MSHSKTRHIYDMALTYEKVYSAWDTVSHTCKNKQGLFYFGIFEHSNVAEILHELKERAYRPGNYRCFMIFEPKPRLVMSQSVKDKVVNHFIAKEYLLPVLEKSLIDTNVATRKGLGSAGADKMLRRYFSIMMTKRPGAKIYALKIDISKYFYSIDHELLFKMLERKIKDREVINLLRQIVDETNMPYINRMIDVFNRKYDVGIPHYEYGKGLSIGAMTSQFLAIFYLNNLDHFIKEKLKCQYYIRYMDDFLIMDYDKKRLEMLLTTISAKLRKLKLSVNPKSRIYDCSVSSGVTFLGYRYYIDNHKRLRVACLNKTARRARKRLASLARVDVAKMEMSLASYNGYFMRSLPSQYLNLNEGSPPKQVAQLSSY